MTEYAIRFGPKCCSSPDLVGTHPNFRCRGCRKRYVLDNARLDLTIDGFRSAVGPLSGVVEDPAHIVYRVQVPDECTELCVHPAVYDEVIKTNKKRLLRPPEPCRVLPPHEALQTLRRRYQTIANGWRELMDAPPPRLSKRDKEVFAATLLSAYLAESSKRRAIHLCVPVDRGTDAYIRSIRIDPLQIELLGIQVVECRTNRITHGKRPFTHEDLVSFLKGNKLNPKRKAKSTDILVVLLEVEPEDRIAFDQVISETSDAARSTYSRIEVIMGERGRVDQWTLVGLSPDHLPKLRGTLDLDEVAKRPTPARGLSLGRSTDWKQLPE